MHEITPPQPGVPDVWKLARAIRFALVTIVLGLAMISLRSSLGIGTFNRMFVDMLAGRPLPPLTVFILNTRLLFVAVSIAVPCVAIATLFLRDVTRSFYVIGVLGLIAIVQSTVLFHGLFAPLKEILNAMSGA